MSRRVVITGLGTVTALGLGVDALWEGLGDGRSGLARVQAFDPSGFNAQIAAEVPQFNIKQFVPKSYRKATKVMARDIELAVVAADLAVRDAGLVTAGTDDATDRSYAPSRSGCHIGAGLIAADLDELTAALSAARNEQGGFDYQRWGREGMDQLTPLWLLKYLPNMLACHVTIIHDSQGPSNTITCAEASGGLSVGESLRVIQRGAADFCFCGGVESKLNPMTFYRQDATGRLATEHNQAPDQAVRPFDQRACGTAVGEGGGILTLEAEETARARGAGVYAQVLGFGASHTIYPEGGGLVPDPQGQGIAAAIRSALADADLSASQVDLIIPFGSGIPDCDRAEAAALATVFGAATGEIPVWSAKPFVGNCGAGASAVDLALAARILREQKLPPRINCDTPAVDLDCATADGRAIDAKYALVYTASLGGQNVALVLGRPTDRETTA
ncbi:MAG: beta-ketoacyl-[acyl-carrier-protein] synthase family protein [Phycisphaerae bacterium]|nr:beta-ketoacyl-[acyl-carrier-protein] synthase family protein [Phycisphaerae bacterium]